jgi:hypothetical protein
VTVSVTRFRNSRAGEGERDCAAEKNELFHGPTIFHFGG